jgi:hypothetical protein
MRNLICKLTIEDGFPKPCWRVSPPYMIFRPGVSLTNLFNRGRGESAFKLANSSRKV